MLSEGHPIPEFALTDRFGKRSSIDAAHNFTIIYFYPKDDTPGCTIEAKEFSAHLTRFKTLNVGVLGISGGNDRSKEAFCVKHNLSVTLLSDSDGKVSKLFGVYGEKKFMGRTYQGILRTTFIINNQKRIVKVFPEVQAAGHAEEVLECIKGLIANPPVLAPLAEPVVAVKIPKAKKVKKTAAVKKPAAKKRQRAAPALKAKKAKKVTKKKR